MIILLAPSETKNENNTDKAFNNNTFFDKSIEVVKEYNDFLINSSVEEKMNFFDIKKEEDLKNCSFCTDLYKQETMQAILRYTGVAFDALDYLHLEKEEKIYIDNNLILFSNLFGVLKPTDLIPIYKFKQGKKLPNFNQEMFYKQNLKPFLDDIIKNDILIDLSASYYKKYYKPDFEVLTFKFLQNGKVISHFAKHYRGKFLKYMARNNVVSESDILKLKIPGLKFEKVEVDKNIKTFIYNVI